MVAETKHGIISWMVCELFVNFVFSLLHISLKRVQQPMLPTTLAKFNGAAIHGSRRLLSSGSFADITPSCTRYNADHGTCREVCWSITVKMIVGRHMPIQFWLCLCCRTGNGTGSGGEGGDMCSTDHLQWEYAIWQWYIHTLKWPSFPRQFQPNTAHLGIHGRHNSWIRGVAVG